MNKVEKKKERANEFRYLGNSYELIYDDNQKEVEFQEGKLIAKNEEMINNFLKLAFKKERILESGRPKRAAPSTFVCRTACRISGCRIS